jgi:hypothetical protein
MRSTYYLIGYICNKKCISCNQKYKAQKVISHVRANLNLKSGVSFFFLCFFISFSEIVYKFRLRFERQILKPVVAFILLLYSKLTKNSVAWVRKRTIPTERPPLVGEISANFSG